MALDMDEALQKVGSFGRYQVALLVFCNLLRWAWSGWPIMIMAFLSAEPSWKCVANSSVCNFTSVVAIGDDNYDKRCNMSREDWEFSDDFTSIVTEFDLVCDKAVYGSVSSSAFFAGWLVALLFSSVLSDKFGRKKVTFAFATILSFCALIVAFSVDYWMFVAFRTLTGFGRGGMGMPMFILLTEFVSPKDRSMMGNSLWYSWTISLVALAGVAYLIRDWVMLTIATAVPGIPFLLAYFVFPESVRWLVVKGKTAEAKVQLDKIARVNGKEPLTEPLQQENPDKKGQRLGDFRDLFATRKLTHHTLLSWFAWFTISMIYYGVFLSAPTVGGNMYLNFFLASIIELPAVYLGIKAYNKFGRKLCIVVCLISAAVSSACAVLLNEYGGSGKAAMGGRIFFAIVLAKFFIIFAFNGVYIYSAELFPTVIRNIGMGTSSIAARCGSISAPYIVYTERVHPLLPYGIMAVLALISGIVCMTGPETLNKPTEEVVVRAKYSKSSPEGAEDAIEDDEKALVENKA